MAKSKNRRHMYIGRAHGCSTGIMQCAACYKSIPTDEKGFAAEDYAYYETSKAYVNFHRVCSADNPAWEKHDAEMRRQAQTAEAFKADCIAFYEKWGVSDFTDEIEDR